MEFKEKQYDGNYEVSEIEIHNEDQIFKGILYFPPDNFSKPYPLILYFHGFPQLFNLREIVRSYKFLLDIGYSMLIFNFRGYRFSEGEVSINSQVFDGLKVVKFVEKMAERKIFDVSNINIIAHDFGAYIGLIICSKTAKINRLLLLSPILDLHRHVYNDDEFKKTLYYINRFLPGNVRGIEHVDDFIKFTKTELLREDFQIEKFIKKLRNKKLKIIIGEVDKITPLLEVNFITQKANIVPEIAIVKGMDHAAIEIEELKIINGEIKKFFK